MKKHTLLITSIFAVLLFSCSIIDYKHISKFDATVINNSDRNIKRMVLGAGQYNINKNIGTFSDSIVVENLKSGESKILSITEKKLAGDGNFVLKITFDNNAKIINGCCYFTNGILLTERANFEIQKDSIIVK